MQIIYPRNDSKEIKNATTALADSTIKFRNASIFRGCRVRSVSQVFRGFSVATIGTIIFAILFAIFDMAVPAYVTVGLYAAYAIVEVGSEHIIRNSIWANYEMEGICLQDLYLITPLDVMKFSKNLKTIPEAVTVNNRLVQLHEDMKDICAICEMADELHSLQTKNPAIHINVEKNSDSKYELTATSRALVVGDQQLGVSLPDENVVLGLVDEETYRKIFGRLNEGVVDFSFVDAKVEDIKKELADLIQTAQQYLPEKLYLEKIENFT